jgi:hypothetical protein
MRRVIGIIKIYFKWKSPIFPLILLKVLIFMLFNPPKHIGAPKDELQITLRLHHQHSLLLIEIPLEDLVEDESNSLIFEF